MYPKSYQNTKSIQILDIFDEQNSCLLASLVFEQEILPSGSEETFGANHIASAIYCLSFSSQLVLWIACHAIGDSG